jgi:chemotaxis signal transduction protein
MSREALESQPWCLFRSGSQRCAIRLESVIEIVPVESFARLPLSPPCLRGLSTIRRDVIPVIRLAEEVDPPEAATRSAILVLRTAQCPWGIQINREGTTVSSREAGNVAMFPTPDRDSWFIGQIQRDGFTHLVFDPEIAWQRVRTQFEQCYSAERVPVPPASGISVDPINGMRP